MSGEAKLEDDTKQALITIHEAIMKHITALMEDCYKAPKGSTIIQKIPGFEQKAFDKLVKKKPGKSSDVKTAHKIHSSLNNSKGTLDKITFNELSKKKKLSNFFNVNSKGSEWINAARLVARDFNFSEVVKFDDNTVTNTNDNNNSKFHSISLKDIITITFDTIQPNNPEFDLVVRMNIAFNAVPFSDDQFSYSITPNFCYLHIFTDSGKIGNIPEFLGFGDHKTLRLRRQNIAYSNTFVWSLHSNDENATLEGYYGNVELCRLQGQIEANDTATVRFPTTGFKVDFDNKNAVDQALASADGKVPIEHKRIVDAWLLQRHIDREPGDAGSVIVWHDKLLP